MASIATIATGLSAVSSFAGGAQKQSQYNFNANLAEQNARAAQQQGATNAYLDTQHGNRKIGAQQAAYGASGVRASGSPLEVMGDQAMQNQLAVTMDRYNANAKAYNYRMKATNERRAGRTALTSGALQAGSTLAHHFYKTSGRKL